MRAVLSRRRARHTWRRLCRVSLASRLLTVVWPSSPLCGGGVAGTISLKNLRRVAKELGENMTEEELQDMIDQADRDGDGEINPDEFYRIMKKRGDNPLDDLDSDSD